MKRYVLAVVTAFVVLFPANGLFHTVLAAGFLNRALSSLAPAVLPMHDARPAAVAILDLTLAMVVVYVLAHGGDLGARRGAAAGFVVNLASSAAWNLGNTASFVDWPLRLTLLDVAWHCALGAVAGLAATAVLRRVTPRGPVSAAAA